MIVGVMATYPGRADIVREAVKSIAPQLDLLHLVMNEYEKAPAWIASIRNVRPHVPELDYKDLGKFIFEFKVDDVVFLLDDDIIYPNDYTKHMISELHDHEGRAVVGVHGVIYSDYYDNRHTSRVVWPFFLACHNDIFVNQLGTGTVCCYGHQMPPFDYMRGSEKFVDVRFARYLFERKLMRICVKRSKNWLQQIKVEQSIFSEFTQAHPQEILQEVKTFCGFGQIFSPQ